MRICQCLRCSSSESQGRRQSVRPFFTAPPVLPVPRHTQAERCQPGHASAEKASQWQNWAIGICTAPGSLLFSVLGFLAQGRGWRLILTHNSALLVRYELVIAPIVGWTVQGCALSACACLIPSLAAQFSGTAQIGLSICQEYVWNLNLATSSLLVKPRSVQGHGVDVCG